MAVAPLQAARGSGAPVRSSVPRTRRARLRGAAVVVASAIAFSACASRSSSSIGTADPGLSHVHGLGIDPADGQLYAASHHGVFRVVDGGIDRAGQLLQDTMGFTVAGPGRFLGSGHPDIRNDTILEQGDRPLLGLIESTDRATSWSGLSLQGEADFHALVFSHDQVYGVDSTGGRVLVSRDLESWETRSQIELSSLAVSPDDPERLVGAGAGGVQVSADGGRTWQSQPSGPQAVLVSWDRQEGLWALGADGRLSESKDGGSTWSERGSVTGEPGALLAHATGLYVATSDGVFKSENSGAEWTVLYEAR